MSDKYTSAKNAAPTELREKPAEIKGKPPLKGRYATHEEVMKVWAEIRRKRHGLYKKLADM